VAIELCSQPYCQVWPLNQLTLYWGPCDEIPRPTEEQRMQGIMDMSAIPSDRRGTKQ